MRPETRGSPYDLTRHATTGALLTKIEVSPRSGEEQRPDQFAFVHRAIVNADGLFRRLGCEADHEAILDIWWRSTAGVYVRFYGPTLLGEREALVLMALLAMAGKSNRRGLSKAHAEAKAKQEDSLAWLNGALATKVEVNTSLRRLAEAVGLGNGGDSLEAIRRSLGRLGSTSVWAGRDKTATKQTAMKNHQLISVTLNEDGSLCVALAPLLIDAMLGTRRDHTYVLLSSILKLPAHGFSRLLAIRLAWINPGEWREVGIATLAGYLWPDREPSRLERTKLRAALKELGHGGWTVKRKPNVESEVYQVARAFDAGLMRKRQKSQLEVKDSGAASR